MSVIDDDHYVTVADVRKVIPVMDNEIEDGTLEALVIAQSKNIVALTNRKWSETDFLWETIQNLVARYVAVGIRERRGEFEEAERLHGILEKDVKALLKSPYLNTTDTGEQTGGSAIVNAFSSPKSPYLNPNVARYVSSWAKTPYRGTSIN